MHPSLPDQIRRIAVIRALHVGDLLTAIPGLRALRATWPEAEITLIGLPWAADLVRRLPSLDRLLEFPGYPGIVEAPYAPVRTQAFIEAAQAYGFDLALQLHGDGTASNFFTLELGARCSAGYHPGDQSQSVLDISLPYPVRYPEVLRILELVTYLGGKPRGTHGEFPVSRSEADEADELLRSNGWRPGQPLIGISPGAHAPARRWRPARFAEVASSLLADLGGFAVVTGTPSEQQLAAEVAGLVQGPTIDVAGRTSLGVLAALIDRFSLLVTNDSGPAHLAAAVGTPSVILFGGADPRRWAPLDQSKHRVLYAGVDCSPCPYWECPIDHRCLEWISPESVLAVALELLGQPGAHREVGVLLGEQAHDISEQLAS